MFHLRCAEMEMLAQDLAFIWKKRKRERPGLGEVRDSIELPGATEMPSGLWDSGRGMWMMAKRS